VRDIEADAVNADAEGEKYTNKKTLDFPAVLIHVLAL
jgi:hypothetical protein